MSLKHLASPTCISDDVKPEFYTTIEKSKPCLSDVVHTECRTVWHAAAVKTVSGQSDHSRITPHLVKAVF